VIASTQEFARNFPGICWAICHEIAGKFGDEFAGKFARRICWEFEVNLPPGILPGETCHRQFAGGIC